MPYHGKRTKTPRRCGNLFPRAHQEDGWLGGISSFFSQTLIFMTRICLIGFHYSILCEGIIDRSIAGMHALPLNHRIDMHLSVKVLWTPGD